jgi:outer membrane lipoprotein-sorting protein
MKKSVGKSMVWLAALFGILAFSGLAIAAEFSADLIQKMGDEVKKGKIFVKDNKMRMEFEEGITIMDLATGKTITIQPEEKMYIEMPGMGPMATVDESDKELSKIATKKHVGTEKISGYKCDKYLITYHDKAMGKMTQWYSKKLKYPIKIVYHGPEGEMLTEYKNIKEGRVSDSLFKVPAGYQKMAIPGLGMPGAGIPSD